MEILNRIAWTRRAALGLAAAIVVAGFGQPTMAADEPLKVAAIYTVPVEQQWVGRIHKALTAAQERGDVTYTYSENVANTDYERVMREYAEPAWT
jgi:basic membrane protein A